MPSSLRARETNDPNLAFVLTGGGARAAYQVGFLRYLAAHYPDLAPGILIGVSAGAMIAMHLASRPGRFVDSVARLAEISHSLRAAYPAAKTVSAGMSGDMEPAIASGATHVRVGTALLGGRRAIVR